MVTEVINEVVNLLWIPALVLLVTLILALSLFRALLWLNLPQVHRGLTWFLRPIVLPAVRSTISSELEDRIHAKVDAALADMGHRLNAALLAEQDARTAETARRVYRSRLLTAAMLDAVESNLRVATELLNLENPIKSPTLPPFNLQVWRRWREEFEACAEDGILLSRLPIFFSLVEHAQQQLDEAPPSKDTIAENVRKDEERKQKSARAALQAIVREAQRIKKDVNAILLHQRVLQDAALG